MTRAQTPGRVAYCHPFPWTPPSRSGPAPPARAVRDLQRRLAIVGHVAADSLGVYGPATEAAVRAFQERRGLSVDGICGIETWSSLVEAGHRLGDRLLYLRSPMLRGDDVAALQALLGALGFDAGRVDGIFGPDTQHAVAEFQRNTGLTTDGICGPATVTGAPPGIGPGPPRCGRPTSRWPASARPRPCWRRPTGPDRAADRHR